LGYVQKTFGRKHRTSLEALVNIHNLEQSRILMAPLAKEAGGWGQITENGWKSKDDPGYKKMRDLVYAVPEPIKIKDVNGTCNRTPCKCGCCWVREARAEYREAQKKYREKGK
jgi:hypothetical protein